MHQEQLAGWMRLFETDTRLHELVVTLDGMLTGRPRDAERNARQRSDIFADPLTFLTAVQGDAYYLADGGYSRVMFGEEGVRGLSSVSRDPVKARWREPDVQAVVAELDALLKAAINNAQ